MIFFNKCLILVALDQIHVYTHTESKVAASSLNSGGGRDMDLPLFRETPLDSGDGDDLFLFPETVFSLFSIMRD